MSSLSESIDSAVERLVPYPPAELPVLPGGWTTRTFTVAGRNFSLTIPATPDALLDEPEVQAAHDRDGYMPYWSYLWPTSLEMAKALLETTWPPGLPTLEIGAGLGLAGLAGLAAGLEVTFSDYDQQSVRLALSNARDNGYPQASGIRLDWRTPPRMQFPLILGCDVIYELQNHAPILNLLEVMLTADGAAWMADPGRHQADAFLQAARERKFQIEHRPIPREPFPGRPEGHTNIWILRRSGS